MGRNRVLRKRLVGCQRVIEAHEEKIRRERTNTHRNEELLSGWQREIEVQKKIVAQLMRRLKREW